MPDDFASKMANPPRLSEKQQKQAGQAIPGDMEQEHHEFLETVTRLIDRGEIDVMRPETFLKKGVYDSLDSEWKAKTDLAIVNIASQLQQIHTFYKSKQTPDSSPHLETMIEHLWDMKMRIEERADVFKF